MANGSVFRILSGTNNKTQRKFFEYLLITVLGTILALLVFFLPFKQLIFLVVGLGVFALILINPEIGFLLMVAALPFDIIVAQASFLSMSPPKLLGVFTFFSWVLKYSVDNKADLRQALINRRPLYLLFLFGLLAVFSIYFAVDPDQTYYRIAFRKINTYFSLVAFYFLTLNMIKSPKFLNRVINTLILSNSLIALYSILQRYLFKGSRSETQMGFTAIMDPSESSLGSIIRSSGFSHYDVLAIGLVITVVLIIYKLHHVDTLLTKISLIFAFFISSGAMIYTGSRSAVFSLAFALVLLIARKIIKITPSLIILLVIVLVTSYAFMSPVYKQRIFSLELYKKSDDISARKELLVVSTNVFIDHWLIGAGMGNFDALIPRYSKQLAWQRFLPEELKGTTGTHNLFTEVGSELGVFGLATILFFIGLSIKEYERARKLFQSQSNSELFLLTTTLEICLLVYLFWSVANSGFMQFKTWWLLASLAPILTMLAKSTTQKGDEITI